MPGKNLRLGIIGGGPAGLAAAISLASRNFQVSLFEKSEFPVDKVCGEGIMPTGVDFLIKHDISDLIGADEQRPFNGVRYILNNNRILDGSFKTGFGLGIKRTVLSNALYKKLLSFDNVQVYENSELVDIKTNEEIVEIEISQDGVIKEYEFDCLIGCDGIRSLVRKLSGLENNRYIEYQRIGAGMHYEARPWTDMVEVYWKDHIEAYVTPVGHDAVQFAFMWDNKSVKPQAKFRMDEGLKEIFPELFKRVEGCRQISKLKSIGPVSVSSDKSYKNRVVLLGDAYMFLDGITGDGISLAFREAECLADSIVNHGDDFKKYYDQGVKRITNNYLLMTHIALLMSYYPILRKIIFTFVGNKLFSHLVEVSIGREKFLV